MAAALGLAEFAPLVARMLGGENAQAVATKVVAVAKQVTQTNTPEDATKALYANAQLVSDFQKEVIRLDAEFEIQLLKDRQSARERDIAIAQVGRRNTRADIMVVSVALGLITCLCTLITYNLQLPGEAVGIISTIAGIFGSCLKDAFAFEFGSSRSSQQKDMVIALNQK